MFNLTNLENFQQKLLLQITVVNQDLRSNGVFYIENLQKFLPFFLHFDLELFLFI